jgi:hypothetical protein
MLPGGVPSHAMMRRKTRHGPPRKESHGGSGGTAGKREKEKAKKRKEAARAKALRSLHADCMTSLLVLERRGLVMLESDESGGAAAASGSDLHREGGGAQQEAMLAGLAGRTKVSVTQLVHDLTLREARLLPRTGKMRVQRLHSRVLRQYDMGRVEPGFGADSGYFFYRMQHHLVAACGPAALRSFGDPVPLPQKMAGRAKLMQERRSREDLAARLCAFSPTVKTITLSRNNRLSHDGALAFALALKGNKSLVSLSLVGAGILGEAMMMLAEVLAPNSTLCKIVLDYGVPLDVRDLNGSSRRHTLDLASSRVGIASLTFISFFLMKVNKTSQALVLSDNAIRAPGGDAIARALVGNKGLTSVDISDNMLGEAGALVLAKALMRNHKIQHVNIARNGIGNEGALAFATYVTLGSCGLTDLDVSYNDIRCVARALLLRVGSRQACSSAGVVEVAAVLARYRATSHPTP